MTKLMLAGDTHGRLDHAEKLIHWAKREKVDRIIQLGDFGFLWPSRDEPERRINQLSKWATEADIPWFWLDGNHDNFDWLENIGAFGSTSPVEIAPNVTYLPRGVTFDIDGISFMACGGAVSIDKDQRTPNDPGVKPYNVSWWHQELITDEDVDRCYSNGKVDVLLTHDAPNSFELQNFLDETSRRYRLPYKIDEVSQANRAQLDRILNACSPSYVFHGHYHERYNGNAPLDNDKTAQVIGLDCDGSGTASYVVLDTNDYPWRTK